MLKDLRVYLIGGNGFVGSGYFRYLSEFGCDVKIISRENYHEFVGSSCDILINANGNSKKFLATERPKEDFIASVNSVQNSLIDFSYNQYIFLSTSDVYPDCSNPELTHENIKLDIRHLSNYGFHKYLAELCVQHNAKNWLIIRQGGFVGEGLKKNAVFDVLYGNKLWVHPDSRFQFIDTVESARIVCELVERGLNHEIFNLSSSDTVSVKEIMEMAGRRVAFDENLAPVTYQISTQKVNNFVKLPNSYDTVKSFVGKCNFDN